MHPEGTTVDLARLSLSSGEAGRLELDVGIEPLRLGGETYESTSEGVPARLDVSRTMTGHAMRLRLSPVLTGPCVRCLERASVQLEVDAREVDQPNADDEELRSPYVKEGVLDAGRWANDAVVLALPAQPLCREDCAGLCAVCGQSLNDADPDAHRHPSGGDPRMAKLRDLKLD